MASNTTRIVLKNGLNCREYIRAESIRTKFFFLECWGCCRVEREFHAFIFRVLLYGVYLVFFTTHGVEGKYFSIYGKRRLYIAIPLN